MIKYISLFFFYSNEKMMDSFKNVLNLKSGRENGKKNFSDSDSQKFICKLVMYSRKFGCKVF